MVPSSCFLSLLVGLFCLLLLLSVVDGQVPPFSCPSVRSSRGPPTNVTRLHPSDIDVVIALGDSITAGFAMQGVPPVDFLEYRGNVFSIGGDEYTNPFDGGKAITIPRWLMNYNPDLQGQAYGETLPLTAGKYLDAAISEAKVQGIPGQIDYIIQTMKTQYAESVDFANSWKLVTLFIGANNLCISCTKSKRGTTAVYEQQLDASLAKLKKELPRTFVNLLPIFNISGVHQAGLVKEYCVLLWKYATGGECPCLLEYGDDGRKIMDEHSAAYNTVIAKLAKKYSSEVTKDYQFTVVAQPGISGVNITDWGEGFLSNLDCFHPALNADQMFTLAIWNNMFTPEGKKDDGRDFGPNNIPPPICPTADSYIQ